MGVGILTFSDTLDMVRRRGRTLVMYGRYSSDSTGQTISRQTNQFFQFRQEYDLEEIEPDHYFHDEGVTGARRGRNGREEWHRLVKTIRGRREFLIWVADMQRFRDFAHFVGFWDEFLRDNDRIQVYIDDDNMLIDCHMTRNEQGFAMIMAWQSEVHLEEQSKKTKNGIDAYRTNNPDKHWGRPLDAKNDRMLEVLFKNQMLNSGKPNLSELARELKVSRAKVRTDIKRLGLSE